MTLKKMSAILLSTTVIVGINMSAKAATLAEVIKDLSNGTKTDDVYTLPDTATVTKDGMSDPDTKIGPWLSQGNLTIDGTGHPNSSILGVVGLDGSTTGQTPTITVKNVGSYTVTDDGDYNYTPSVKSAWTNLSSSTDKTTWSALNINNGKATIENSVFALADNTFPPDDGSGSDVSGRNGAAISIGQGASVDHITGSMFFANKSASQGGAIDIDHTSAVIGTISDSYFIANEATVHGGALDVHGKVNNIENTVFANNKSTLGGAVYIHDAAEVKNIKNAVFARNEAGLGGAMSLEAGAKANISDSVFVENISLGTTDTKYSNAGSAIETHGELKTSNTTFKDNITRAGVSTLGGTVYVGRKGSYISENDTFEDNDSGTNGGAVYNSGNATINGTTMSGNKALSGKGGAIYNEGTLVLTGKTQLTGNKAALGDNLYNAQRGNVEINNVHDNIDLDYHPYQGMIQNPGYTLFDQTGDIYNAGTMTVNNSELQLHNGINTNASLTEAEKKVGTINIKNSRIDLGGINYDGTGVLGEGVMYAESVNIDDGSTIQTHVSTKTGEAGTYGKIVAKDINVSDKDTKLGVIVGVGELKKGEHRDYTILEADNGVNGEFEQLLNNKMYDIESLGDGTYRISVKEDPKKPDADYVCPGCDRNETNTNDGWLKDVITKDMNEVAADVQNKLNECDQTDSCDHRKALDGIAPDVSPLVQAHTTEITRRLAAIVSQRFYNSMERTGYTHRGKRFYRFPRHESNLWIQGMYGKSKYDIRKGWDLDTSGIAVGFDGHINEATRLGISYAYTKGDGNSVARDTEINSHTGMVYGEYNPNRFYANWLAMYTRSEYDESKKVFDHRIKANYDVDAFGAQVMVGRKMGPYVSKDWATGVIKPEIGARYIYTKQHAYTDGLGQKVGSADGQTLTGIVGAQYTIGYTLSPTLSWYPELRAALTYDLIEPDTKMRVNLVNGSTYEVKTENMDRFGIEVGARVGLDINRRAEVSLEYEGLFKGDYTNHTGLASLKYKF